MTRVVRPLAATLACLSLLPAAESGDIDFVQLGVRLAKPATVDPMSYTYTGSGPTLQSQTVDYVIDFHSSFMASALASFNLLSHLNAQTLAAVNASDPRERQLMGSLGYGRLYTMIETGSYIYQASMQRSNAAPVTLVEDGKASYTQVAMGWYYGETGDHNRSVGVAYRQITWPMVIRIKDTRATGKAAEGSSALDPGTKLESVGPYLRMDNSIDLTASQTERWYGIVDFYAAGFHGRMSDDLVNQVKATYGSTIEGASYDGVLLSTSIEMGYHIPVRPIGGVRSGLMFGGWFQTDYFFSVGTEQKAPTQAGTVQVYPDEDGLYGRFVYGFSARMNTVW